MIEKLYGLDDTHGWAYMGYIQSGVINIAEYHLRMFDNVINDGNVIKDSNDCIISSDKWNELADLFLANYDEDELSEDILKYHERKKLKEKLQGRITL